MKHQSRILIFIITLLLTVLSSYGQNTDSTGNPVSYINLVGRYTEGKGVELRFFPDNKSVLEIGFKSGFILERMLNDTTIKRTETDTLVFDEIARIFSYKDSQWETAVTNEKSQESKNDMEIARDFMKNIDKKEGIAFDFDKGIGDLKNQKSKEDYEYLVFALTALKNANVATALGLAYTDNTAVQGKSYYYRVRLIGKSDVYQIIPVNLAINAENLKKNYDNQVFVKQGDGELFFTWIDIPELSGYYVERANPGEDKFTQLNNAPIHNLSGSGYNGESRSGFNDKNLTNYQVYTYRFFGNTLFGEKIQFAEVKAMPKDMTPPEQPFLEQPQHVKPKEVLVAWKMNLVPAPDLKGFIVARSDKNEGDFKVLHSGILSKETRTFTDTSFIPGQANYYVVQAIDTANNISSSFPVSVTLLDTTPPAKPVFLTGTVDSLGVVTLSVEKNKEKDLMGYRLFKANEDEHEFSAIYEGFINSDSTNQEVQTVFKDTVTLNSLTPFIYYKVKALDFNYNQSEYSDVIKITRPDTVPPSTPVFKDVIVNENSVELYFALSESIDVIRHTLYRKTSMDAKWDSLTNISSDQTGYTDKNVKQGTTYYYTLRAKDNSGLYSNYAVPVSGKPYDNGVRPPIENISITKEKTNIVLTWEYKQFNSESFFIIYKKDSKGNLKEYQKSDSLKFVDSKVSKGTQSYAVKVFTKDGGQSKISKIVEYVVE